MDMTASIAAKSDQLDAVDLLSGPQTFTIERVSEHNSEQPFNFHLADFPRVWRPGKSMRRVIVAAWGGKVANYVGQRITLYCDPSVEFGGAAVGGTRISHMTGIDKPLKVPLLIKKGRSAVFTVQPLPTEAPAPARDWLGEAGQTGGDIDLLRALYKAAASSGAAPDVLAAIQGHAKTAAPSAPADES